jgi:hypothetical protein
VVGGKRKCLSGAPKSLKLYVFSAYAFRGFDYAVMFIRGRAGFWQAMLLR